MKSEKEIRNKIIEVEKSIIKLIANIEDNSREIAIEIVKFKAYIISLKWVLGTTKKAKESKKKR